MDKLKHWIIVLERIKTEMLWSPYENDVAKKIGELIKEMEKAQTIETSSIPDHADPNLMSFPGGISENEAKWRRQEYWNKTCANVHCGHGNPDAI